MTENDRKKMALLYAIDPQFKFFYETFIEEPDQWPLLLQKYQKSYKQLVDPESDEAILISENELHSVDLKDLIKNCLPYEIIVKFADVNFPPSMVEYLRSLDMFYYDPKNLLLKNSVIADKKPTSGWSGSFISLQKARKYIVANWVELIFILEDGGCFEPGRDTTRTPFSIEDNGKLYHYLVYTKTR